MRTQLRLFVTTCLMGFSLGVSLHAQTWTGITGGPAAGATSVGAANGNTLYAGFGGNNGVYRSTDNGLTWSPVNTGLVDSFGGVLTPDALFRTSSGRILRGGDTASWNNRVGSPVFYSDNGTSWSESPYPFNDPSLNNNILGVTDFEELGGAIFMSDTLSTAVWKSTNNGVSWSRSDNGLPFVPFSGFKFARALAKSGSVLFSIDPTYGVYRSTDGGASWQPSRNGMIATPNGLLGDTYPGNDVHVTADGTVYAIASSGLYKSTNAGLSWTIVGQGVFSGGPTKLANVGNAIYVASAASPILVYESTDGGAGWQLLPSTGLPTTGPDVLANSFLGHNSVLYLCGTNGLRRLDLALATRTPIAPVAVSSTGNIGVNVGEPFTLSGQFNGTTPFSYQWLRGSNTIAGATSNVLTIASAITNDAAIYSLIVSNAAGRITNVISTVTVAPRTIGSLDYSFMPGFGSAELFNWNGFFASEAQTAGTARQRDGKIIATGNFTYVGRSGSTLANAVQRSTVARFNLDGTVDTSFNVGTGPNFAPDAVALTEDGRIYIGGSFTTWNGVPYAGIVRLNADGSLDRTFNLGQPLNGRVYAIVALPDGRVAIGGTFTTINGRYRGRLAILNEDGSLAPGLGELSGVDNNVFTLTRQADGKFLAGGDFFNAEFQPRTRVARFNVDGSLDTNFNVGSGAFSRVWLTQELPDGRIFVSGEFNTFNGVSRNRMTFLSPSGSVDTTFVPPNLNNSTPFALVPLTTNLFAIGGGGGLLVVLDGTGALITGGVSGIGVTRGLTVDPDGRYTALSSGTPAKLTRFFGAAEPFTIVANPASTAAPAGSNVTFSVTTRGGAAAFQWLKNGNPLGGQTLSSLTLNSIGAGDVANYSVIASNVGSGLTVTSSTAGLTLLGSPLITRGPAALEIALGYTNFLSVRAIGTGPLTYQWRRDNVDIAGATNEFFRFGPATLGDRGTYSVIVSNALGGATSTGAVVTVDFIPGNLDLSWNTLTNPVGGVLIAPAPNGRVYVAGNTAAPRLYRFNVNGTVDTSFATTNLGNVNAIAALGDGRVLVAHGTNLIRINTNGVWDSTFTNRGVTGFAAAVTNLTVLNNGQTIVAGNFTTYGGVAGVNGVIRLNPNGTVDTTRPWVGLPPALVLPDGTSYRTAATNIATTAFTLLQRYLPDDSLDTGFNAIFTGTLSRVAVAEDGGAFAYGSFTNVNGAPRVNLAKVASNGSLDTTFAPTNTGFALTFPATVNGMLALPGGKLLAWGGFLGVSNASPAVGIARFNADGSLDQRFNGILGAFPSFAVSVNAVQPLPDGRLALAGNFTNFNGVTRASLAVVQAERIDPAITLAPFGGVVADGSNVVLNVAATSTGGNVAYQWLRNGVELANQTNTLLNLGAVNAAASGIYSVRVTSPTGTNTASTQLNVIGAPFITRQPQAPEPFIGLTNRFTVEAIGAPVLRYQWTFNGNAITNATNTVFILSNAQPANAGTYAVTISNSFGLTNSVGIVLNLTNRPGSLITNWQSAVPSGGGANFTDVAVLPDGRYLVAGNETFGNAPYFARLNPDGTQDGTFAPGLPTGVATGNLGKFAIAPDGSIYLMRAGTNIVRFNGTNGAVISSFVFRGIPGGSIADLAVAPDGRLLLAGSITNYGGAPVRNLIRLNPNGTLDGGFRPMLATNTTAVAVQPDGRVIAGVLENFVTSAHRVRRFNADGSVDSSFSPGNTANGVINKIELLADGRFFVGGAFDIFGNAASGGLVRLGADGARDFTFFSPIGLQVTDLAVQFNGRVVIAGFFQNKTFARLNADGSHDAKFQYDFGPASSQNLNAVAIDAAGRILYGGGFNTWNPDQFTAFIRRGLGLLHGDAGTFGIFPEPVPQFVTVGAAANFSIGVTSTTPTAIQWRRDGTNLLNETNLTLNLANVQSNLAGYYSAVVNNGSETRTSRLARLAVLGAPVITAQPVNVAGIFGRTASFGVGAEGAAPVSFQWRRAGSDLGGETNSVLVLSNLQFAAAGNYDVVAANSFGAVTSAVAVLTVQFQQGSRDTNFFTGTGPNQNVTRLEMLADGRSYIVGGFTSVAGTNRANVALLNVNGTLNSSFSNATAAAGTINAVAVQSDGRVVVGGNFTTFGAFTSPYLARYLTNGQFDSNFTANFLPGPSNLVNFLAVQPDDKILVGGQFTAFSGQPRTNLARLNADGSLDYGFQLRTNFNGLSAILAQSDGRILLGSSFAGVARFLNDGSSDSTWTNLAFNSLVTVMREQLDGKILVGGQFTTVGGQNFRNLARLNTNGTLDTTFNTGTNLNGSVSSIVVQPDGRVLVSGNFTSVGGVSRIYAARFNTDGSLDTTFDPGAGPAGGVPNDPVIGIQPDGRIVLAGGFTQYDGTTVTRIVGVYGQPNDFSITSQPVAQTVNAGAAVNFSVGVTGPGSFGYQWSKNGTALPGETNATLSVPSAQSVNAGLYRVVVTRGVETRTSRSVGLTVLGTPLFVVQPVGLTVTETTNTSFFAIATGGSPIRYQWQRNGSPVNGATNPTLSFAAVTPADAGLYTLTASNGFGTTTSAAAALNVLVLPAGALDQTFLTNGPNSTVNATVLDTNTGALFVGGAFSFFDGRPRSFVAKTSPNGSLDTNYLASGGPNSSVTAIELEPNGQLVIAGAFTQVSGTNYMGVARLNTNGTLDTTFSNAIVGSGNVNAMVRLTNGQYLIGGSFTNVGGITRSNLARLNSNGTVDATWGETNFVNATVQSISLTTEGKVIIGGSFTNVLGSPRNQIARLNENGTLDGSFTVSGVGPAPANSVLTVAALPNGQLLVGGTFTAYAGTNRSRIALLNSNGTLDTNFSPVISAVSITALRVLPDSRLLVGGNYSLTHNGTTARGIMRFFTNGLADTNFAPGVGVSNGAEVRSITPQSDGKLIIGGSFTSFNNVPKNYLARLMGDSVIAPQILSQPQNVAAQPGNTVLFSVAATGVSPLTFQWRREGTNLFGATNSLLTLTNVSTNLAGGFSVVISNSAGVVTSAVASLSFNAPSPFQQWATGFNLSGNDALPGSDPDDDDLPNVVEYALGLPPNAPSVATFSTPGTVNVNGTLYPAITFIRSKTAAGVNTTVRAATDVNFGSLLGTAEVPPAQDLGNGTERVTVRCTTPFTSGTTFFFELRVQQQ